MQTLSLQRLTYSRRKRSHDVNAPISFLIKKKALLSLMVQLHYCQNHSVCISVPQSPNPDSRLLLPSCSRTNTGRGYTLRKPHVQLFCNQSKLSLCVWENVSLSEHDLIVFPDCAAERGRVCVFIVVFHHNLKWAFIVLVLHFRNHPFSNSDGWCQEIWGALSHFFLNANFKWKQCKYFWPGCF